MKIAICDDMQKQLEHIEALTNEYLFENELVAEVVTFPHSDKLLSALEKENFHIYILDIVMPMVNGIELGREIRRLDREAQIIYTTTAPEYALDSFSANPINYLIKPVDKIQFHDTLRLAMSKIDIIEKTIMVKTRDGIRVLDFSSIVSLERRGNAVSYYLLGGETVCSLSIRSSFSDYAAPLLLDKRFIKPHTSFVINMKYVKIITPKEFKMKNGSVIPIADKLYQDISKTYLDFVFEKENKK